MLSAPKATVYLFWNENKSNLARASLQSSRHQAAAGGSNGWLQDGFLVNRMAGSLLCLSRPDYWMGTAVQHSSPGSGKQRACR